MARTAVVAGGGLAGIAAAMDLADAGWKVTLLESKKHLGGMVSSFPDPAGGPDLDNGEHIAIEACTELLGLFQKLDCLGSLKRQPRLRLPFVGPDGRVAELTESAWSFLTFPFLSLGDRWRVARAIRRIGKMTDAEIAPLDNFSAADWLEDIGQTPESIARFWEYFISPALNEPANRASASLAARVLRDAMGLGPKFSRFCFFRAPLGNVFANGAAGYLANKGGEVKTLASVTKVKPGKNSVTLELAGGEALTADVCVLALPHADLAEVFPESAPPLEHSPILNAHLWYDRPVTDLEVFAMLDCRVHWVFNRSVIAGLPGPGQQLSCSISAARDWAHHPSEEIAAACDVELKRRFKGDARLVRFVVSREHRATFSARPGTAPMRPGARTRHRGLYLAGAWTDTGYPATMEGAVRSGRAAAREAGIEGR
ncbi:MAG: hydroxysqualene dehydroxylase HpnE [Planctomycetes bacterium]|nr:hydroxysqualene dehydroxylase HpnE [Planctomycetota bacterium]